LKKFSHHKKELLLRQCLHSLIHHDLDLSFLIVPLGLKNYLCMIEKNNKYLNKDIKVSHETLEPLNSNFLKYRTNYMKHFKLRIIPLTNFYKN